MEARAAHHNDGVDCVKNHVGRRHPSIRHCFQNLQSSNLYLSNPTVIGTYFHAKAHVARF